MKELLKKLNRKQKGQRAENEARKLLKNKGYRILAKNFFCAWGEIDLIALDGDWLVFVEVKTRFSDQWGSGIEAVNRKKCEKIAKSGQYFRLQSKIDLPKAERIDVIYVTHYQGEKKVGHEQNVYRPGLS